MNKRDITLDDFTAVVEVLASLGIQVTSYDNVWSTMFFQTDEWSLSLSVLKDIDERLREKTDFYLFSTSVPKGGERTLGICVGFREN